MGRDQDTPPETRRVSRMKSQVRAHGHLPEAESPNQVRKEDAGQTQGDARRPGLKRVILSVDQRTWLSGSLRGVGGTHPHIRWFHACARL